MRWHRSDEVPENGAKCLCKCKRWPDDTELMVLEAHVYRDSSGDVQIYDVLCWCPLDEIDAALTASNGETSGED